MKQLTFYSVEMTTGDVASEGTATINDQSEVVLDPLSLREITDMPFFAGGVQLTPEYGDAYLGALYRHFGEPGYFWAEPSEGSEPIEKIDAELWRHHGDTED